MTPQAALMQAKPPFAITHKPGHMFVTDLRDEEFASTTLWDRSPDLSVTA